MMLVEERQNVQAREVPFQKNIARKQGRTIKDGLRSVPVAPNSDPWISEAASGSRGKKPVLAVQDHTGSVFKEVDAYNLAK